MRLIDADALYETAKNIWNYADSEDFEKEIFIAIATTPTIEERKTGRWNRLMMYLADLQLTYAPVECRGDIRLYEFVKGLIEELEGWEDGGGA